MWTHYYAPNARGLRAAQALAPRVRIISFIEEWAVIRKILVYLDLWETRNHDPPAPKNEHITELVYDDSYSQIPQTDYWLQ